MRRRTLTTLSGPQVLADLVGRTVAGLGGSRPDRRRGRDPRGPGATAHLPGRAGDPRCRHRFVSGRDVGRAARTRRGGLLGVCRLRPDPQRAAGPVRGRFGCDAPDRARDTAGAVGSSALRRAGSRSGLGAPVHGRACRFPGDRPGARRALRRRRGRARHRGVEAGGRRDHAVPGTAIRSAGPAWSRHRGCGIGPARRPAPAGPRASGGGDPRGERQAPRPERPRRSREPDGGGARRSVPRPSAGGRSRIRRAADDARGGRRARPAGGSPSGALHMGRRARRMPDRPSARRGRHSRRAHGRASGPRGPGRAHRQRRGRPRRPGNRGRDHRRDRAHRRDQPRRRGSARLRSPGDRRRQLHRPVRSGQRAGRRRSPARCGPGAAGRIARRPDRRPRRDGGTRRRPAGRRARPAGPSSGDPATRSETTPTARLRRHPAQRSAASTGRSASP